MHFLNFLLEYFVLVVLRDGTGRVSNRDCDRPVAGRSGRVEFHIRPVGSGHGNLTGAIEFMQNICVIPLISA